MTRKIKTFISTAPFGEKNKLPIEMLENANIEYKINDKGRRLSEIELTQIISDYDVLIAGTEPITKNVLDKAKKLKLISRVGIGLDNVDLNYSKKKNILVSYTPDAPGPAVAELTLCFILNLLRSVHISNHRMHNGVWNRYMGKRIADVCIGIIGVGRIGQRVIRRISNLATPKILANDLIPDINFRGDVKVDWVNKEKIIEEADIISIHLPLTVVTKNLITKKELSKMKKGSFIINTSRGGIINEKDLFEYINNEHLGGAAIDVFEEEPYKGELQNLDKCLITSHMGSMSEDCRVRMEIEATEEVVRFSKGLRIKQLVPEEEYNIQKMIK